jgi:hypothetical protein
MACLQARISGTLSREAFDYGSIVLVKDVRRIPQSRDLTWRNILLGLWNQSLS